MFTMDDILNAKFGVNGNKVDACFKKTVKIKEFETEVIEVRSSVELPDNASGVERLMTLTLLQAQLEYMAYSNLAFKSIVTENELDKRKKQLMADVDAAAVKYEKLTGESPYSKFIDTEMTSGYVQEVKEDTTKVETVETVTNSKVESVVPMELGSHVVETPILEQELKEETVVQTVTQEVVQPVAQPVTQTVVQSVQEEIKTPINETIAPINTQQTIQDVTPIVNNNTAPVGENVQQNVSAPVEPVVDKNKEINEKYMMMMNNFTTEQRQVYESWPQEQKQVYFQQFLDYLKQQENQQRMNNFGNSMNQPV